MAHVPGRQPPGQRRELMHDHLGLGGRHRLADRAGVERVGHNRARSQAAHQVLLRCAPGHPDHLVASPDELGDELSAENARGAGYEDLHNCSSTRMLPSRDTTEAPRVTLLSARCHRARPITARVVAGRPVRVRATTMTPTREIQVPRAPAARNSSFLLSRTTGHPMRGSGRAAGFRSESTTTQSSSGDLVAGSATKRKPGPSVPEFRFDPIVSSDLLADGPTHARFPRVAGRTPTATRCARWQQCGSARSGRSE